MSVLTVKNISHGFGDRAIFEDVSFRLLKGEHVGLIGANGEGKSTFMNIITSKLMPDEGKVIWSNRVRVGYMDQHAELEKGLTIRDVLRSAFKYLFDMEAEMNDLYNRIPDQFIRHQKDCCRNDQSRYIFDPSVAKRMLRVRFCSCQLKSDQRNSGRSCI